MTQPSAPEATTADRPSPKATTPPPSGGAVYGLGFIGALVWFWRRSDGVGGHVLAVGKAAVWPAILVHDAFRALHDR